VLVDVRDAVEDGRSDENRPALFSSFCEEDGVSDVS